jgi:DNA-binding CsgD family transcriptional regulator
MNGMLYSTKKIHDRYSVSIKETCSVLLDHFNVNKFYYHKICDSGRFFVFDSNLDFTENFDTEELFHEFQFYCHPKYQQTGVQIINVAENLQSMKMEITKNCMLEFDANLWIRLVHKTENSVEEFGFHSSQSDEKQCLFIFNQIPQLNLFAKFFRENNPGLFSSLEEVPVNLLDVIGLDFYENRIQRSDPNYASKQKFLKQLGIDTELDLSPVELDTLRQLVRGYTASQIAKQVYRSKRTIEHRIENIKSKLFCYSKQELIQKAQELKHIWINL